MIFLMRRLIQIAFAGWIALSMTIAQAFAFPADSWAAGAYTPVEQHVTRYRR